MGNVPKPLLVLVTVILALCVLAGFAIGILPALKRGAVADEEEAPVSSLAAASSLSGIKDAQPLAEPAPPPPKPKAAPEAASSQAVGADAPPQPLVKAAPLAVPPLEGAPGAPPGQAPAPAAPKPAGGDLPPT